MARTRARVSSTTARGATNTLDERVSPTITGRVRVLILSNLTLDTTLSLPPPHHAANERQIDIDFRDIPSFVTFEYFDFRCLNRNNRYETLRALRYRVPSFVACVVLGSQEASSR